MNIELRGHDGSVVGVYSFKSAGAPDVVMLGCRMFKLKATFTDPKSNAIYVESQICHLVDGTNCTKVGEAKK